VSDEEVKEPGSAVTAKTATGVARRFGDDEIERILRTAAELQERAVGGSYDPRGLTQDELRQVALEAGIDPRFVDLAVTDLDGPVESRDSAFAGGPFRWHFNSTVDGEVPHDDRDQILLAVRSMMGTKGEVAEVFGRFEWTFNDGAGPIILGVSSRDGRTEIDLTSDRSAEVGLFYGLGMPFGGIFGGAAIAGLFGISGPLALLPVGGAAIASYGVARLAWRWRSRSWDDRLRRLVERISSTVQGLARLPPGDEEAS